MKPLFLLTPLLLASIASADIVLTLTDGSSVQGSFTHDADGYHVTKADGTQQLVPDSLVRGMKPISGSAPAASGNAGLDSLRRAASNIDDLSLIIKRYNAFIAKNATSPSRADAEKDLALWQDRADKKMVRVGGNWVTPAEFDKLKSVAMETAQRVAPMISAGKLKEASAELEKSLIVAPTNPDLQYLKGIIAYKQSQLGPAKTAFQTVGQEAPSHGASHNNAAVALVKTHAAMPALAEFEKAMQSMPGNQIILDNVAETLHALPIANQKNELTKRVVDLFNIQDADLQRKMAAAGFYRWGSKWIDKAEYAVVQAQKKEQQDKLDAIKKEFDANNLRLTQIDRQISDDQVLMQQIMQANVMQNPQGQQVALPPPPQYYSLQRDQIALSAERDAKKAQQISLNRAYQQQAQQVIQGTFSGVLNIFEADAFPSAPASVVAPPAVAPSSNPNPGSGASATPPTMPANPPPAAGKATPPKPKGPGDY